MLHPEFRYLEPQTLPEATALLAAHGGAAVVIGGGTMLVPEMSNGKKRPRLAIGLRRLGLNTITVTGGEIIIGASVNYAQLIASELIATELPLLHAMACEITGGPQIRNQGTLAGAAAYANPTSDAPACLLAHDAEICLNGPQGERRLRATDFYLGAFRTARKDDELLTAISFPLRRGARHAFRKIKHAEGSGSVRMTGIAFLWIGATTAFGSQVRKPNSSKSRSPSRTRLTRRQAFTGRRRTITGRSGLRANHTFGVRPPATLAAGFGSAKDVKGTTHRFAGPSHRRQCGDEVLRMFVTPGL